MNYKLLLTLLLLKTLLVSASCSSEQAEKSSSGEEKASTPEEFQRGAPPNFPPGMAPPPMPKSGNFDNDAMAGDAAPDGLGVVVGRSPTAGPYNTDVLTYVPWEDESAVDPLPVGAKFPPESMVLTSEGKDFDLNAALKNRPTVLIYYRGGWCPFCNAHLHELQTSMPALEELGYQILAVSTDTVASLKNYRNSTDVDYQLLVDPELKLAAELGIKYKLTDAYIEHVATLPEDRAIDLKERNGGYLVSPAAFILDTAETIQFVYVNNNYSVRISQESLLQQAEDALQK